MEIELPDGTVLDAPDGADVKKVVAGYRMAKLKAGNPGEYDPNSKEFKAKYGPVGGGPDRYLAGDSDATFREGIGSGMYRANRGLSNWANKMAKYIPAYRMIGAPDFPGKEFYGDEAIRNQDALDKPLANTTRGAVGQAVGQGAVTAAVTAPLGGLGAIGQGGGILTRTLAGPGIRALMEGAVGGAAAADPDEQGMGALKGALMSWGVNKGLQGLGRAVRGLANKSEAVRDLEAEVGRRLDIPLSQSLSDEDLTSRTIKALYQEGIPNIFGIKGRLARQSAQGLRQARAASTGDLSDALIEEIFSEPATRSSRMGSMMTSAGLGYGTLKAPLVALGVFLGGHGMASRVVQRALTGDTAAQRTLAQIAQAHPDMIEPIRQVIQGASAAEAGKGDGKSN